MSPARPTVRSTRRAPATSTAAEPSPLEGALTLFGHGAAMMRTALFALLLTAAAPAAAAERNYPVTDFDRIQVEGPYEVTLVTGGASAARGIGSDAALEGVTVEVQSGLLRIHPNRSAWGGYPGDKAGPVKIAVS